MKVSLKKDSLAYQFGVRPGVILRNMAEVPLQGVVDKLRIFTSMDSAAPLFNSSATVDYSARGHPERDAVVFYLMNHAMGVARQKLHPYESLGALQFVIDEYHNMLAIRSARMFYYILLICTREARHSHDSHTGPLWDSLAAKYGASIKAFHASIKGSGSGGAVSLFKSEPPACTLGAYTLFLSDIFHKGSYSGGYGGPAWGAVADVLRDFVHGKISAEIMLDTAFTLCHNNGPIFNKGMLFDSYTGEIYKILDVQRSGQIPQLIANKETGWANNSEVDALFTSCKKVFPEEFGGYVDWYLVEELGSKNSYYKQKQLQVQKYGHPTKFKAKIEAEEAKKKLQTIKLEAEQAKLVQIYPGIYVKKMEVARV